MRCVASAARCVVFSNRGMGLFVHGDEEFFVGARHLHSLFHEFHSFEGVHVGKIIAENPHSVKHFLTLEKIIAAS